MDWLLLIVVAAGVALVLRKQAQQRRIAILAHYLQPFGIEPLMERIVGNYMRALAEDNTARQQQIWLLQHDAEASLASQFRSFTDQLAQAPAPQGDPRFRICNRRLLALNSGVCFDLRAMMRVHADGIARAVANAEGRSPRARAFSILAELYLMQHTCHWYCKSKAVASARMQMRNQTSYEQLVRSVPASTRQAYQALTGGW